ncbi:MAG: type II secretion system protein GspG [Candidatus Aminicenantes bacterium]|nr:MAG: type II secretion system protein GspG [Candidatus Aminicenantes bacterium]
MMMKGTKKRAFTLIEVLMIIAIIGTLLALMVPSYTSLLEKARINQVITDIVKISRELDDFLADNGTIPETLNELAQESKPLNLSDPWGNPYEYLVIFGKSKSEVQGKWRKDRFLVPINSDYDLYSMGKDGESTAPLTAQASWDDIIRANDGGYFGLAHKY